MHTLCLTRNTKSIQKRSEIYSWSETRELCLMSVFSHKGVDESGTCDDTPHKVQTHTQTHTHTHTHTWSKQKSFEDTFSPTPSLPMIGTLLAECCTREWEVRHKDLGNSFCATPLEGRSLYVKAPSGLSDTREDTIWSSKRQFMD
jgi:hypothetical protein